MKNEESLGLDKWLMCDAERHFDYLKFDELLELAADVCLKNPLKIEPKKEASRATCEQAIIQKLGTRGLSVALDLVAQSEEYYFGPSEDESGELINVSSPLRRPDSHSLELNGEIQDKIESFGAALLDEAYISLGTDVKPKIREFQEAQDDAAQIEVLNWLSCRVQALKKTKSVNAESKDQEYLYHPVRLSPRALGQYPHNVFDPTCLGNSILTASFARQTGAPTLHAGVMMTVLEVNYRDVSEALGALFHRDDIGVTDSVREQLRTKDDAVRDTVNTGFHAASLVRLKSGAWYMLDPNYRASYVLPEANSRLVQSAYEDIHSFGESIKNIERTVDLDAGYWSLSKLAAYVVHDCLEADFDRSRVSTMLIEADGDFLLDTVRNYIREVLTAKRQSEEGASILLLMEALSDSQFHHEGCNVVTSVLDEAIEASLNSFFLYDEHPDAISRRLKDDSSYRERRVEDVRLLPYLTVVNAALLATDRNSAPMVGDQYIIHSILELGATEHRVGAAVLSDFATYCDDNLSYSFWATHWASRIPITERLPRVVEGHHQQGIVDSNMAWLEYTLQYMHQGVIVNEFLSREEKE